MPKIPPPIFKERRIMFRVVHTQFELPQKVRGK
jgi:hypothetical protein